jgi:hypothetical protein
MGLTAKQKRSKLVREARRVLRVASAAGHFDGLNRDQANAAALDVLAGRYPVDVQAYEENRVQVLDDHRVLFKQVCFTVLEKKGEDNGNQN